ncbi:MAG: prolyl oligopeptidase family serine peptidase, partial [Myxococcales bacterium]|nr:prolyl oligopeptidase family serine peptidase [Myxococcales bacterium]
CSALALVVDQEPIPGGYALTAKATAATLLPPGAHRWRWSQGDATLSEGAVDTVALALGGEVAFPARAKDGDVAKLAIDGDVCERRKLAAAPALRDRFLAAREAVEKLPATFAAGTRDSLAYAVERLAADLGGDDIPDAVIRERLDTLEALLATARGGADPYEGRTGVVVRAYRSDLDGSLQPYVLLVPPSYARRDRPVPLIVAAHGLFYTPEAMARIISGKPTGPGPWRRGEDFEFRDVGALIVSPDGYGNAGHRPPGERDLLRVIDEVRAAYRVDDDRVSLTGFSLGGSVGFWLPFHHPDLFSAAAPLCGYPNVPEYRTVRAVKRRPFEDVMLAAENIVNYAENGRYVPLRIVHGAHDQPQRSAMVVDRYKKLRYPVDFEVVPNAGHNIWDHAFEDTEVVKWMIRQERPRPAKTPRLRTARYRWDSAYWLRLDHLERQGAFAELEGKLRDKTLAVTTDNADAFTILAAELAP